MSATDRTRLDTIRAAGYSASGDVGYLLAELDRVRAELDEVQRRYTFDTAALKRRVAELEAEKERSAAHTEHLATTLVARTQDLMAAEAPVAELEGEPPHPSPCRYPSSPYCTCGGEWS